MTGSPVHFSAHLRAQVPVHLRERADARNTSLRFHRERSHAVPTVFLAALDGQANRRLPCPRIQHRNAEIISPFPRFSGTYSVPSNTASPGSHFRTSTGI